VSPKNCSLALDEDKEVLSLEPELNLLVKSAMKNSYQDKPLEDVVRVEGRIIISF
jgi:hypothetical protein